MNIQPLPAGISGAGIEVFRDNESRVFFLQDGKKLPYLMMRTEDREYFQAELAADQAAMAVLSDAFGLDPGDEMEEMFAGCRFGNLDYRADLIGGKLTRDAPRCNRITSCVGFNIVCRIPMPPGGALTRREYEIVSLIAQGKQTKEISDSLHITDATTRTHIQRIHAKLGVNNNVEVAAWAHEKRII
ncbi:MAG: LuxR C-terminal-related transcriptional regulator [Tannerellaceae bacterium]|jgi:DNA-binding CsgD family transcriptional regulator|nr:LuxR C-terminal-related transcriptional regulator [Tannerellaceae bacterium]